MQFEQELHPTIQLIYHAIVQLVSEKEIEEISLSDIAAVCYLQKSSIAYHFDSTKDMLDSFCAYYCNGYILGNRRAAEDIPMEPDPVRAFCRCIDEQFEGLPSRDPRFDDYAIYSKCYQHLVRRAAQGQVARDFFAQLFRWQYDISMKWYLPYLEAGILDPARYKEGVDDQWMISTGVQLAEALEIPLPDLQGSKQRLIESVKRNMLRDGLYIPPEEQYQDP